MFEMQLDVLLSQKEYVLQSSGQCLPGIEISLYVLFKWTDLLVFIGIPWFN